MRERALARLDARAELSQARDENQRQHYLLKSRIDALHAPGLERRAYLEIDVEARAACDARLQIEYSVPGACWRPAHRAELLDEDGAAQIRFETDACVWQNTGEDWPDVQLSFSTERASLGVAPPALASDTLRVQKKSQTVHIEAREQAVETLEAPSGTRAPQVPGIDDGGVALHLEAVHRSSLASDGRPHRVHLHSFEAPADLALVAMPEINPCVLLSSKLDNAGGRPLLAGPVDLIRNSGVVGRSQVLYVADGERFELGWGPEPELRLRRRVESSSEKSRVLSSWRAREHTILLHISNIGDRRHRIHVTERVPVSEIDKVKIEVDTKETCGRQAADKDGFVHWDLEVAPAAHESLTLRYRVKKHEDVAG